MSGGSRRAATRSMVAATLASVMACRSSATAKATASSTVSAWIPAHNFHVAGHVDADYAVIGSGPARAEDVVDAGHLGRGYGWARL